jgi:ethanolamine transporter
MFDELIKNLSNTAVFTDSVQAWVKGLSINGVIMMIMMIFMIVGAIDRIRGNKLGYGEQWESGFLAMGDLAMAMAGVVAAAPVLAIILQPIVSPVYTIFGADTSMFATTLLACDMGGYPLAMQLAADEAIGNFAGLILGTMMGPTIVFTIPVALGIIKEEDRSYLGAGILAGMITVPIGCIAGGLVMNMTPYKIGIVTILQNLIPVIIVAALIVAGLWFIPTKMINGFNHFGNAVTILITIFTAIAVFEYQTGIVFPLMNIMVEEDADGVIPLESGLLVCGQIAITLIGAFPMVLWIQRTFKGPLSAVGKALGMNDQATTGMIANLANNIAMFNIMGDMDPKGKILNCAFAVSAAFVFGDHLGFTAGANKEMIFPMIVGKLVAGITAIIVANVLSPLLLKKVEEAAGKETAKEA